MGSLFDTRNVFRIHFFLLFFVSFFATASESTDRALSWLLEQQKANGAIYQSTDIATEFQSSIEASRALRAFGKADIAQFNQISTYINSSGVDDSTENLAKRISVNYRNGISVADDVAQLLTRKNNDGGFGAREGYDSTVMDTAYALWSLGLANFSSSDITNEAIAYIIAGQLIDGSWTNNSRPQESVALTSQVLEALRLYSVRFNLQQTITKATNYLVAQKNIAGTWVDAEHTTDSLLALIPLTPEPSLYADALTQLKSSQHTNGSWNNDTYITARALYAIYLSENLPPVVVDNAGSIKGQLIDLASGAPLSGVSIHLSGVSSAAVVTDTSGQFSLDVSERGLYTLAFEIAGFKSKILQVNITKLQAVNLGQIRLEPSTPVDPTVSIIHGVVLDAISQLPLAGVEVSITGGQTNSVVTNANGEYAVSASAGDSTITVKKSGYQDVVASATITLGQKILFSPVLYPEGESVPTTVGLKGFISDAVSGDAIATAILTIQYQASTVTLNTDGSGEFNVNDLASGEAEITISAPGYTGASAKVFFVAGTTLNLGDIKLWPLATSSKLHGIVSNAVDHQAIPFALIKITNSPLNTSAKVDGSYEIAGIGSLEFTVEISAPGFVAKTMQVSTPEYQSMNLDIALDPVSNEDGLGIQSLRSEFPAYRAYTKAMLLADFSNNSTRPVDLQMVLELKGDNGYYLRAPASHVAFAGDDIADSLVHISANSSSTHVSFEWLTDVIPPGRYEARLLAYDLESLQLLAEKATSLEIQTTKVASAIVGSVTPKFSYLNAEPTISFNVDITNQSNAAYELPVTYKWVSPDGAVLEQGIERIQLVPNTYRKSVLLKSFSGKFTKSGNYILEVAVDDHPGIDIGSVISPTVSVAPSVRIDPLVEISPTVITPESDKKIKVTFKLKGIEENE